jgi:hypothetical protein
MFDKRALPVLFKSDLQFLFRVHHNGTMPGDRLPDGPPGNKQEPNRLALSRNHDLIAILEEDDGFVPDTWISVHIKIVDPFNLI